MKFWKLVFAIWVFLWIFFLIRGLYKGEFEEYKALLGRDAKARRAYIMGEDLYGFMQFSLANVPKGAAFCLEGALTPIDRYRLIYYLYPRIESKDPAYILCYGTDDSFSRENFYRQAAFKKGQFILRRR